MFEYLIEMKMAAKNIVITPELENEIANSAIPRANSSAASIRNNRTISFEKRVDDYTLLIKLTSKDKINATRSLSSLSTALLNGKMNQYISEKATYNGCVINAKVVDENFSTISNVTDIELLSTVASLLFAQTEMRQKEKELARTYEQKLRALIVEFLNQKNEL